MTPYQPTSLWPTILALVFYILMAAYVLYSLLAIYALVKFGRSKGLAILVSLFYLAISSGLYAAAVINLNNIKF
ncbi:MAG: hypothetical protein ABI643_01505 [Candidatus Doudnabacteria bacterium]